MVRFSKKKKKKNFEGKIFVLIVGVKFFSKTLLDVRER